MIQVNEVITPNKEELFALYGKILESGKITNNGQYVRQLGLFYLEILQLYPCYVMSLINRVFSHET